MNLHLSIYPRARNIDKARKAIDRVQERLSRQMTIKNIERNSQDKSTFRVDCTIPLNGESAESVLFESLQICQTIAACWLLFGPEKRIDGHWEFHGHAQEHQMQMQGIKYAAFGISDGPIPEIIEVPVEEK